VYVKTNAADILDRELSSVKKGVVIIGSVHDPYQPAEKTYTITHQILQVIKNHGFPCHILTKSPLVLRDIELLASLKSYVTVSLVTLQQPLARLFERHAPSPKDRLRTIERLSKEKIRTGAAIIPIIPYVNDSELGEIVKAVHQAKGSYVLHQYLELKGDQKQCFTNLLSQDYPSLISKYQVLYKDDIRPLQSYRSSVDNIMKKTCSSMKISEKIKL